jgi:hypothetical protein
MIDASSPLIDFYPTHFQLDQNEKKNNWEYIVVLTFIDERRLLDSVVEFYPNLNDDEHKRNEHQPHVCFRTSATLRPIDDTFNKNPYFPALQHTRASSQIIPIDTYRFDARYFKQGHFQDNHVIHFPHFPILNVLPYKYSYKVGAVNLFNTYSRVETLVLNLIHQPDTDCIVYNTTFNTNENTATSPFQINNLPLLIQRYLGQQVFVDWPHVRHGIVCAISDFENLYLWSNGSDQLIYDLSMFNSVDNDNRKHFLTQMPMQVACNSWESNQNETRSTEWTIHALNSSQIEREYSKAMDINRHYERQRGISIGPIPLLLYVCPLLGYRTSFLATSCPTAMCFSNQAFAYPLQTIVFTLPNYQHDVRGDHLKKDDHIFSLASSNYASYGRVEQIDKDEHGKYSISCQFDTSYLNEQPDLHQDAQTLLQLQIPYFTAQQVADRLNVSCWVISRITGTVNVNHDNRKYKRIMPTNIGFVWKSNRPMRKVDTCVCIGHVQYDALITFSCMATQRTSITLGNTVKLRSNSLLSINRSQSMLSRLSTDMYRAMYVHCLSSIKISGGFQ